MYFCLACEMAPPTQILSGEVDFRSSSRTKRTNADLLVVFSRRLSNQSPKCENPARFDSHSNLE